MCSTVARTGLGRISGVIYQHPAHGVAISGVKSNALLQPNWTVQKQFDRHNARQPTGGATHVSPYIRIPFFHERGPGVGIDQNLQERLDELFTDKHNAERVDIGFMRVQQKSDKKGNLVQWRRETRKNRDLEKAARAGTLQVDIDKVKEESIESGEIFTSIHNAAEFYGIYEDMFREGYFYPCVNLDIAYALEDDMMAPVYRGNMVKPREAASQPEVTWKSKEDDIWCLALTGLDTHLTEENQEYVHWLVGNIKGSDLTSGQELFNYMQPFPPFGTGYHRFAFVLYKQEGIMDFSSFSNDKSTTSLAERTFNTYEFYQKHQDDLTPAGLAFFQSDWDSSLRDFFHNTLQMKEPRYEYEFQAPHIEPWREYEIRDKTISFNEFLDQYRDPKDIEREVLVKKLAHTHPYHGDTEGHIKYPLAHEQDYQGYFDAPIGSKPLQRRQSKQTPSWRMVQIMREKTKDGFYASTDHSHLRTDPQLSQ
eukprot:TRINITY_DN6016_c0_g1_i2.p1 TRINITY_DN6016_c0_g1~~TRINITY_DN6016_c0_g1_i2.p1  ORF type:complete len:480 (-),score=84.01 TRINITY_DN6016_c0_g1_i2:110-1549(-)